MGNYNYYVVRVGRKTGIFYTWDEAFRYTNGYPNNQHEGFYSYDKANEYYLSGNREYGRDQLVKDIDRYSLSEDVNLIRSEIIENYDNFIRDSVMLPPSSNLSKMVLTSDILKELGVDSIDDLEYVKGAFKVNRMVNLRGYSRQFIGVNDEGYIVLSGGSKHGYLSGINNTSVETPKYWDNQNFPSKNGEFLYHRGHVIAKSFQQYTRNKKMFKLNRKDNLFISTNWLNHSNHVATDFGVNQTYIENCILKIIEENPKVRVNYRAKLLFSGTEKIPRGIHIMVEFKGRISSFSRNSKFSTLNIFIPNIDSRFIVDYKREN